MNPADRKDSPPIRLRYRLLTGPDDKNFCERVSKALEEGYELYGSPSISISGDRVIVAQAVIWPVNRQNSEQANERAEKKVRESS